MPPRARHFLVFSVSLALGSAAAFLTHPSATPSSDTALATTSPAATHEDPQVREIALSEAGTFAARYDEIMHREMANESERYYLRSLLIDRWLDIDPAEAAEKLVAETDPAFDFFAAWGTRDPEAAVAVALRFKHEGWRKMSVAAALASLAETDPQRFFEIAAKLPKDMFPNENITKAFAAMAERDPEGALASVGDWGDPALDGIALGWVRRNPTEALAWALDGHPGQWEIMLKEWAKTSPHSALDYLAKQPNPSGNQSVMRALVGEMAQSDPDAALDWLQKHSPSGLGYLADSVFVHLKGTPEEQWRKVSEHIHGYSLNEALGALGSHWSAEDYTQFIESARDFPPELGDAAAGMMNAWGKNRFDEALAYARNIEDPEQRRLLLGAAFSGGSNTGNHLPAWQIALDLVPEYRERFKAPEDVTNEELAIALLQGNQWESSPSMENTAFLFGFQQPELGARWLAAHPRADEVAYRATTMLTRWADRDPTGASTWLASLPPSKTRDFAALGLVQAVAPFDPSAAFVWATEIGANEQRAEALDASFRVWKWSDPAAATAALDSSSLPDSEKTRLRNLEATAHE